MAPAESTQLLKRLPLLNFIILIFAVAYVTQIMLLESHGPFKSKTSFVVYAENQTAPVGLFDRVRRFTPFNPYTIKESHNTYLWYVDSNWGELWACPKCLSFWMSVLFVTPLFLTGSVSFYTYFAVAFASGFLNILYSWVEANGLRL